MQTLWFVLLLIVCAWMIVGDLRGRHVDNRLVGTFTALVVLAPLVPGLETNEAASVPVALAAGLGAFCIGLGVYWFDLIGGGDVKLLFGIVALETWLGSTAWLTYLGFTIAVGAGTLAWHVRSSSNRADTETEGGHQNIPLAPTLLTGVITSTLLTLVT